MLKDSMWDDEGLTNDGDLLDLGWIKSECADGDGQRAQQETQ